MLTGKRKVIIIFRVLSEQNSTNAEICLCYINYTKVFDKVQHKDLFELLGKLDLFGKDIRIIHSIYWKQTICIWIENKLHKIEKGIRL